MEVQTTHSLSLWYAEQADRYGFNTPLTEFDLPELIRIEPIHTCNLRCIMCHVSYEQLSNAKLDIPLALKHLQGLEGKWIDLGSTHEPTAHPQFAQLIQGLSAQGAKLSMTTNGTLLTPSLTQKIAKCNFEKITISFDSARKETYESIRRNANYDRTLAQVLRLKEEFSKSSSSPYFVVNNTLMKRSLDEIVESVDLWEKYDFDHLFFIVMAMRDLNEMLLAENLESCMDVVYEKLDEAALKVIEKEYKITIGSASFTRPSPIKERYSQNFWAHCVKSNHPKAKFPFEPISYFQNGKYPGMHVACRSPFKTARIDYHGNVLLCQDQFIIGNIHEQNFVDIWYGEKAREVRSALLRSPKTCSACDYYRFCIQSAYIDYNRPENFRNSGLAGERVVKLLEEFGAHNSKFGWYNILSWMGDYYGIPQSHGSLDIKLVDVTELEGVVVDSSLEQLKARIRGLSFSSEQDEQEQLQLSLQKVEKLLLELQQANRELVQAHNEKEQVYRETEKLQQANIELAQACKETEQRSQEVERLKTQIAAMESSKFWRMRSTWFKLKKAFN